MIRLTRRQFLGSLLGLGATLAIPSPLVEATQADIDQAWDALLMTPFVFEVSEYGTIIEPGFDEPKIRRDVYNIDTAYIKNIDDLIHEVDQYDELRGHFQGLVPEPYADSDDGWRLWLEKEKPSELPRLLAEVDEWLSDDLDWSQMEFWPDGWSGQGKALNFFEQLGLPTLEEIGVTIIEGEHPGSSYYAAELQIEIDEANAATARLGLAELQIEIDEANAATARLGLPFKFKAEGA